MEDYNIVKNDFNEISELKELKWNHNNCYFKHLLKFVPNNVETSLDIGCGKGELSQMLSEKSKNVRFQKDDPHSKEVWERHGKHDTYMTIKQIKLLADNHIPTAKIKRKIFWRYTLIWQK